MGLLEVEDQSKADIADYFSFDVRQSDYYCNALKVLGLAKRATRGIWSLTEDGFAFAQSSSREQHVEMAKRMLRVPAILKYCISVSGDFGADNEKLTQFIEEDFHKPTSNHGSKRPTRDDVSSTVARRQQTILSWCFWLNSVVG